MKTKRKGQRQAVRIEFHHEQAQAVFIAGTFNDWHASNTPMIALGNGRWGKELSLPPGRYEYRIIVDGQWMCDPAAAETTANSYGDFNSVFNVPPKPSA